MVAPAMCQGELRQEQEKAGDDQDIFIPHRFSDLKYNEDRVINPTGKINYLMFRMI